MGIYKPDGGTINLFGKNVSIQNPAKALHMGIAMIHQELYPVPEMTIAVKSFFGT